MTGRTQDICQACEADLPWIETPCQYCSLPLNEGLSLCSNCQANPTDYSAIICALEYRFPVDGLIQQFKNTRHLASGRVLAELLLKTHAGLLRTLVDVDTSIIPVPLHWRRRMSRGFNQAEFVADIFANALGCSASENILQLTRTSSAQKTQSKQQRQENLIGAFECKSSLAGKRILLVDDVVTTTSTVAEAAKVLKGAGAEDVIGLALARTPSASEL